MTDPNPNEPNPYEPTTDKQIDDEQRAVGDDTGVTTPSSPNSKPRVWTSFAVVILALFLAVMFQGAFGAVLAAVEISRGTDPAELGNVLMDRMATPPMFMLAAAAGQLGFLIAVLIAVLKSPEPFRQRVAWYPPRPSSRVYPIAMLSSIFPLALGLAAAYGVAQIITPDASLEKLFDRFTVPSAIVFVIFIGVVPGIVEELMFRGYIQQRLTKAWGTVIGIVVTSVLFSLVHVTPHAIAAVVPLAFWFGYIAWRSGSILPTIACHIFVNSGLNAWRMIAIFGELSEGVQNVVQGVAVAIGVVCFVICCRSSFWRQSSLD